MIIGLLFLILFAILFPKLLRFLFVLIFLGALAFVGGTHAAPAQCSLTVDGKNIWNGKCRVKEIDSPNAESPVVSASSWEDSKKNSLNERWPICGPWINIYPDNSAQWNTDGSCHGGDYTTVIKTAHGDYRGDNFQFRWKR